MHTQKLLTTVKLVLLQPHIEPLGTILLIQAEHVLAAEQVVQPEMLQFTQVFPTNVVKAGQ